MAGIYDARSSAMVRWCDGAQEWKFRRKSINSVAVYWWQHPAGRVTSMKQASIFASHYGSTCLTHLTCGG
jgi:hypothetical protein